MHLVSPRPSEPPVAVFNLCIRNIIFSGFMSKISNTTHKCQCWPGEWFRFWTEAFSLFIYNLTLQTILGSDFILDLGRNSCDDAMMLHISSPVGLTGLKKLYFFSVTSGVQV